MAEYRFSPAAEQYLIDIWRYTSSEWGEEQAQLYALGLKAMCVKLAEAPLQGQDCDHIRSGYRRYAAGRHIIYYRLADYGIAVMRILHQRMDAARHMPMRRG